jgi:hypothetical protein
MLTAAARRASVLAGALLTGAFSFAPAALADTRIEMESDDDSVEIGVELNEEQPGSTDEVEGDTGSTGSDDSREAGSDGCEYITVNPDLAPSGIGEQPSPDHVLIARACRGENAGSVTDFQWVEADEAGNLAIDPEVLAAQAIDSLELPMPSIAASPNDFQLVNLATWMWLEGDSWETQTASASVPGTTVTARAVPVKAVWDMGDGNTETCTSAGTPWSTSFDELASSPDCGYTYTHSSARAPSGEFTVSVTVTWDVTWSGGGESETVPGMTTTASTSWPVAESQSLQR